MGHTIKHIEKLLPLKDEEVMIISKNFEYFTKGKIYQIYEYNSQKKDYVWRLSNSFFYPSGMMLMKEDCPYWMSLKNWENFINTIECYNISSYKNDYHYFKQLKNLEEENIYMVHHLTNEAYIGTIHYILDDPGRKPYVLFKYFLKGAKYSARIEEIKNFKLYIREKEFLEKCSSESIPDINQLTSKDMRFNYLSFD